MLTLCGGCGKEYDKKYTGWETNYVPNFCSQVCFIKYLKGGNILSRQKQEYARIEKVGHKSVNKGKTMRLYRSMYEMRFNSLLIRNNIYAQYEPYYFEINNNHYLPDFLVVAGSGVIFFEVKGIWEGGAKSKFKGFIKKYNFETYLINRWFLTHIGGFRG